MEHIPVKFRVIEVLSKKHGHANPASRVLVGHEHSRKHHRCVSDALNTCLFFFSCFFFYFNFILVGQL